MRSASARLVRIATAITDAAGHFKLDNVPVGNDIPLVIQVGKWRRQLKVPTVAQCVDTPLAEADIRLPKKKAEGDLPQMAITTGGADVMECLLRKIGVDDSEFTMPDAPGRVHFYAGSPGGASTTHQFAAANGGGTFPGATAFWSDKANLLKYDIVILSCEGDTYPAEKPDAALKAMYDYANAGGRLFASHWHRFWFNTVGHTGMPAGPRGSEPEPVRAVRHVGGPQRAGRSGPDAARHGQGRRQLPQGQGDEGLARQRRGVDDAGRHRDQGVEAQHRLGRQAAARRSGSR